MTAFDETQHPRGHHTNPGSFSEKTHSEPESCLPQNEGETIAWVFEGDDHEPTVVEAITVEEACQLAADAVSDRYGKKVAVDLTLVGTFRGDTFGYSDELEFVPRMGLDEKTARRVLENW